MTQLPLIEPTGAEVGPLALGHLKQAEAALRQASICDTRGWPQLAAGYVALANEHSVEAECLAMLAEWEKLGGVTS